MLGGIYSWNWILIQLFGGCCNNVYTLESIMSIQNKIGSLKSIGFFITFVQFLAISIFTYTDNVDFSGSKWYKLYLRQSKIPLLCWAKIVAMYFTVLVLNNLVLSMNISMPTFIVFRLASTVVTMLVGYLFGGNKYNSMQIISCILISLGAFLNSMPPNILSILDLSSWKDADLQYLGGLLIMTFTSFVGAFMGLYNEKLFKRYGNQWKESLFYTHFLGLPLFLVMAPSLLESWKDLMKDNSTYPYCPDFIPKQVVNLLLNVITQYICIRGVNYLVGASLALTVSVVLVLRKFVSLVLSFIFFDNEVTTNAIVGSVLVLLGALLYSTARTPKKEKQA